MERQSVMQANAASSVASGMSPSPLKSNKSWGKRGSLGSSDKKLSSVRNESRLRDPPLINETRAIPDIY